MYFKPCTISGRLHHAFFVPQQVGDTPFYATEMKEPRLWPFHQATNATTNV